MPSPSDDGGLLEFDEFWFSCAWSFSIKLRRVAFSACIATLSANAAFHIESRYEMDASSERRLPSCVKLSTVSDVDDNAPYPLITGRVSRGASIEPRGTESPSEKAVAIEFVES